FVRSRWRGWWEATSRRADSTPQTAYQQRRAEREEEKTGRLRRVGEGERLRRRDGRGERIDLPEVQLQKLKVPEVDLPVEIEIPFHPPAGGAEVIVEDLEVGRVDDAVEIGVSGDAGAQAGD